MNAPALDVAPVRLPLRVEDFMLLNAHGAFADYAKSELIEGEVIVVNAQFRRHAWIKRQIARAIDDCLEALASPLVALVECSVEMAPENMPEPDIVLTTEARGDGPVPLSSVSLLVEVADSSLSNDIGIKARVYARHGVAEYWVADVEGERLIRMTRPDGETYDRREEFALAGPFEAATIPGLKVERLEL